MGACESCEFWNDGTGMGECLRCRVFKGITRAGPSVVSYSLPKEFIERFSERKGSSCIFDVLIKLEPSDALCLVGRHILRLTCKEMARIFLVHRKTIERHISRGTKDLRLLFGDDSISAWGGYVDGSNKGDYWKRMSGE